LLFHNIFFAGTAKLNIHPRLVWLCLMDISFVFILILGYLYPATLIFSKVRE